MISTTMAWLIAWCIFCVCVTISSITVNIIKYKLIRDGKAVLKNE